MRSTCIGSRGRASSFVGRTRGNRSRTLDGVDRVMGEGDLLICDLERPVAIAGIMGGATSEVDGDTTDVLLESATFTRTGILRTARRLDLHTEASHRFERGTDPEALEVGAARGAQLMAAWTGGTVARGLAEDGDVPARRWVAMRPARASSLIGYRIARADAEATFDRLAMSHRASDAGGVEQVEVEVPGFRVDIDREVDLIEEVARLLGYDRIGVSVPPTGQAGGVPEAYGFRSRAVEALVGAGLREVRLLTFASADDLAMTGHDEAVPVANPLQADESFLRTRLLPGLVHAVARNQARRRRPGRHLRGGHGVPTRRRRRRGTPARGVRAVGTGGRSAGTTTPARSTPSMPRASSAR